MSDMPDLTRLADTDVSVEAPRLDAGEPWTVTEIAGLQFYEYAKSDEVLGEVMP